uniref:Uncharacterized protein n=1 Tax=Anopheles atroparvus TaxID=41427 RepID=A0AAG5DWI3_ANOAO
MIVRQREGTCPSAVCAACAKTKQNHSVQCVSNNETGNNRRPYLTSECVVKFASIDPACDSLQIRVPCVPALLSFSF